MTPDDCRICGNALLVIEDAKRGLHPECVKQAEEYDAFIESMSKYCRCARDRPCDGVLAGGICDDIQDDDRDHDDLEEEL